jgi:PAS domain S-box-containing protein
MSKRDRHLKQRLEELFSSSAEPAAALPEDLDAARHDQPPGDAGSIGSAEATPADVSHLKVLIERLPLPAYLKDREHTWVAVNAAFAQLLGHTPEDLVGHSDKEQADEAWQLDDHVLDNGLEEDSQETTPRPDGTSCTRRTRRIPLFSAGREVRYVLGIVEETTTPVARVHTPVAESDETFRAALDALPSPVIISRLADDVVLYANQAFTTLAGTSPAQVVGQPVAQLYAARQECEQVIQNARQHGELHGVEVRLRRVDGTVYWASLNLRCLGFNNEPCVITTLEDISAQKQTEADLKKFKLGIDQAYYSVMITTVDGTIVYVNPAFTRTYGYTAEEALGRKPSLLKSGKVTPEQYAQLWKRLLAGQIVTDEIINKTKDGRLIPIETHNSPILNESGQIVGFVSMQTDISARKQAEAELRKFQQGLEHSTAAIFITDLDGVITYVNPAFETIYGFTRQEAIGQTPRIIKSGLIPQEQYQHFWAALLSGQTVAGEIVNKAKDGRLVPIEGSNNPILDENGNSIGFLALHADVSQRKQAEADLLKRNQQLAAFNRLGQELAQLATVHEVVEHVYQAIGEVFDNRNLYIALNDEHKQEISFPVYTIDGERRAVEGRPFGNGMTEYILRTKKTLLIPRQVQEYAASVGIANLGRASQCYLGIPLLSGDKALGAIAVQDYDREEAYSSEDVELLSAIAAQAAAALENVRLYAAEARRAVQLQTAAEISTAAGTVLSIHELLPQVVNLIQQRFNLYYVGLFLVDAARQNAVLRAGTGEAGQIMLDRGHQLLLDDHSMIGWCIQHQTPRIALDVGEDAVRFNNPTLPDTRSELALPLISRSQVLGAMTVQSREAAAFSEQDIAILQTLSDQIATAIANAQLFEEAGLARQQAEARLRETQFLQRVGQAVSASLDLSGVLDVLMETLQDELGFTHNAVALLDEKAGTLAIVRATGTAAQLQGLTRPIAQLQHDITLDILRQGQLEIIDGWDDRFDREIYESQGHAALVRAFVPLRLRGESIGLLEVGYRRAERARITPEEVRLLSGLADQIAIAVGNARLFADSRQRIIELQTLNDISQIVVAQHDLSALLQQVGETVLRIFAVNTGFVALYDDQTQTVDFPFYMDEGQSIPVARRPLGQGLTSHVIEQRQLLVIPQLTPELLAQYGGLQTGTGELQQSWLGVPIMVGNAVLGVLNVQDHAANRFGSDAVRLLSTIAGTVGVAIQSARLFEEIRARAEEQAALYDLSQKLASRLSVDQVLQETYRGVSRLLDATNFYIGLYSPEQNRVSFLLNMSESQQDQEIVEVSADQGLTGYIIRTKEPLLIREGLRRWEEEHGLKAVGEEAASWLGVPLLIGQQLLGVMAVQSYTADRLYDEHDRDVLMAIANQAVIALQNARLFEQINQNTRELAALNELGRAVSQQIEIEQVLEVTYRQLQSLAPIDAFFAALYDRDADTISLPVIYDEGKRYAEPAAPFNPNSTTGKVIVTGEPILRLLTSDELAATQEVEGALGNVNRPSASLLYVPLNVGAQTIGTLSIQSYQINAYGQDTVQLVGNVANQVAIAIQNARLFNETRQRSAELTALNQIIGSATQTLDLRTLLDTVLKQTLEFFGFDGGLITMYNEGRGKLERIVRTGLPGRIPDDPAEGLENSLCAYVFNSREPLVIEDFSAGAPIDVQGEIEAGYYSYIGVPLEARGRMLGTWCGFRKSAGPFGKNTLALLQAVGHQLGFAIENAYLFNEAQARARREQTLREITARVRSSTDPDAIARAAVRELGQALGRETFIRLGDAGQLGKPPQAGPEAAPASGNGHKTGLEGAQ